METILFLETMFHKKKRTFDWCSKKKWEHCLPIFRNAIYREQGPMSTCVTQRKDLQSLTVEFQRPQRNENLNNAGDNFLTSIVYFIF